MDMDNSVVVAGEVGGRGVREIEEGMEGINGDGNLKK